MKYLLDTHVIIWSLYESSKLSDDVKAALLHSDCRISVASLWEIAIKNGKGNLKLDQTIQEIADMFEEQGTYVIGITPAACDCVKFLPDIHRDPFDRVLIAQAQTGGYTILTKDRFIRQYDVRTMW